MRIPPLTLVWFLISSSLAAERLRAVQWIIPQPRCPFIKPAEGRTSIACENPPCNAASGAGRFLPFLSPSSAEDFWGKGFDGFLTNSTVLAHNKGAGAYVEVGSKTRSVFRFAVGMTVAGEQKPASDTLPPDKALFNRFQSGGGTFVVTLAVPILLIARSESSLPIRRRGTLRPPEQEAAPP